jgi:hypothetical protein
MIERDEKLEEDAEDTTAFDERDGEPLIPLEEFKRELERNDKSQD